jgi:hypothetical protein
MANIKISQLSSFITISGTNTMPLVQGTVTKKVTVSGLMNANFIKTGKLSLARLSGTGTWTLSNNLLISGAKTIDINNNVKISGLTTLSGGAQINTKVGFFGVAPIVQPTTVATASAGTIVTQFNLLLGKIKALGLIA